MKGKIEYAGEGRRVKVEIRGENYYFVIGENWIIPTVPYENREDRAQERALIEEICAGITSALEGQ